jgi:hypothetical protein
MTPPGYQARLSAVGQGGSTRVGVVTPGGCQNMVTWTITAVTWTMLPPPATGAFDHTPS